MKETASFRKDLELLTKKMQNKIIKNAQKSALKPLAAAIKANAPVESGEIKASIKTKVGPRRKNAIITIVDISTPEDNPHAGYLEFGTRLLPAEPFIRPVAKSMKEQIIEAMAISVENALN